MLTRRSLALAAVAAALIGPAIARAQAQASQTLASQPLPRPALIAALKAGGYVIVMRHAHAPAKPPAQADPADTGHERELDAAGRTAAAALGGALKALAIQVGAVWSSPTFRARQTVRLAGLPAPTIDAALGDGGTSMQAVGSPEAAFLKALALTAPTPGTDTLVVTQMPNIVAAFGVSDLSDGEGLVFRPDGKLTWSLVGRLTVEDWTVAAGR